MGHSFAKMLLPFQIAVAIAALAALALWPPASGAMMLVPIAHRDANAVARIALAGHALLLGSGPLRGSIVVRGERSAVMAALGSWDVVVVAAPPAACGAGAAA